jgi:hypothetical protein
VLRPRGARQWRDRVPRIDPSATLVRPARWFKSGDHLFNSGRRQRICYAMLTDQTQDAQLAMRWCRPLFRLHWDGTGTGIGRMLEMRQVSPTFVRI